MRITPLDARKQEFGKAMRGYDCDEVQAFLTTLADEYEAVLVDNKQIRERVMEQDSKLNEYMGMERNLRDTLLTAERVMTETKETASKEGDVIIKDAEMKARGIMEECRMRTEELRREIVALRKEKETYLARFKSLAESQIQFVESHKNDFEDLDRRLVDIVDSVVAGATKAETRPSPQAMAPNVYTKPVVPATPAPSDTPAMPEVDGPDPFTAPSIQASEEDQWRDYNPGTGSQENSVDSKQGDEAVAIADLVSESLSESPEDQAESQDPTSGDTTEAQPSNDSGIKFNDQNQTDKGKQESNENQNQTEENTEEKPATIW